MQSLIYLLIYLYHNKELPWSEVAKTKDFRKIITERTSEEMEKKIFEYLPEPLHDVTKKIMRLEFEEEPPYIDLREVL